MESGGGLLSRAVTRQVPSALKGLTSVFGMGTGDPLRHCHRKLWRSLGSGAQAAFTLPGCLLLGPSPRSPAGLWTGAFPCPRSSPDSRGGALPPWLRLTALPSGLLLRQVFCCVLGASACFQSASASLLASAPPLATTLTTAQLLTRPSGFLACSYWSLLVIKPSAY